MGEIAQVSGAHLRVDHAQPEDELRLRVLGTDHGGTYLLVDDPADATEASQGSRMRASQTPSIPTVTLRNIWADQLRFSAP